MKKTKGRPKKGKQLRVVKSLRIEPGVLKKLLTKYKSEKLQAAFDAMTNEVLG